MQDGRAVDHRLAHVQHRRQDLVLDLDQVERVLGDVGVDGGDGGDGVADVEHLVGGQEVLLGSAQVGQALADHGQVSRRSSGKSAAVTTALTPGSASALEASMLLDDGVGVRAALDAAEEHARAGGRRRRTGRGR